MTPGIAKMMTTTIARIRHDVSPEDGEQSMHP
jgi:hypothetical protein